MCFQTWGILRKKIDIIGFLFIEIKKINGGDKMKDRIFKVNGVESYVYIDMAEIEAIEKFYDTEHDNKIVGRVHLKSGDDMKIYKEQYDSLFKCWQEYLL